MLIEMKQSFSCLNTVYESEFWSSVFCGSYDKAIAGFPIKQLQLRIRSEYSQGFPIIFINFWNSISDIPHQLVLLNDMNITDTSSVPSYPKNK